VDETTVISCQLSVVSCQFRVIANAIHL
jgi:hypothetical protein